MALYSISASEHVERGPSLETRPSVIIEDDQRLSELVENTHSIAVLGAKSGKNEDAYRVPRAMQRHGYRILPVNPKLGELLGEICAPRLAEITAPIDLVDVFRARQHIPGHVEEILALDPLPRGVWLQLGIRDDESAQRLAARGIEVVQDRCLWVEHERLLGDTRDD